MPISASSSNAPRMKFSSPPERRRSANVSGVDSSSSSSDSPKVAGSVCSALNRNRHSGSASSSMSRRIFIGFEFIWQAAARFSLSLTKPERYDYGTVFIALALVLILALGGIALVAAAAFLIHGTANKNEFGVNLNPSQ